MRRSILLWPTFLFVCTYWIYFLSACSCFFFLGKCSIFSQYLSQIIHGYLAVQTDRWAVHYQIINQLIYVYVLLHLYWLIWTNSDEKDWIYEPVSLKMHYSSCPIWSLIVLCAAFIRNRMINLVMQLNNWIVRWRLRSFPYGF